MKLLNKPGGIVGRRVYFAGNANKPRIVVGVRGDYLQVQHLNGNPDGAPYWNYSFTVDGPPIASQDIQ